jgi:hypothetical protein
MSAQLFGFYSEKEETKAHDLAPSSSSPISLAPSSSSLPPAQSAPDQGKKKSWREKLKEEEELRKKREEEEKKKRTEKVSEMEKRVKEKGKKEKEEGKTVVDGDAHNATAEYARESAKNAGWRERKEGERSYLPPEYEKWTREQVQQWVDQNQFSSSLRDKMASLTGKDLKTLTDARLKELKVVDEKERREVMASLNELNVILENIKIVK